MGCVAIAFPSSFHYTGFDCEQLFVRLACRLMPVYICCDVQLLLSLQESQGRPSQLSHLVDNVRTRSTDLLAVAAETAHLGAAVAAGMYTVILCVCCVEY